MRAPAGEVLGLHKLARAGALEAQLRALLVTHPPKEIQQFARSLEREASELLTVGPKATPEDDEAAWQVFKAQSAAIHERQGW